MSNSTFERILKSQPEIVEVLAVDRSNKIQLSLCWTSLNQEYIRFVVSQGEYFQYPTNKSAMSYDFNKLEDAANFYDSLRKSIIQALT